MPPFSSSTRAPLAILISGCLIAMVSFGPRSALGFFTTPILQDRPFSIETFSMAMAVQNLLWGMAQPVAGAIADRYGAVRVLVTGLLLYASGLVLMAHVSNPYGFTLSAGLLIGMGLAGSSFNLILSSFTKLIPASWRPMALGAGTAAGSLGQFIYAPLAVILIREQGWEWALLLFALVLLLMVPLAFVLKAPPSLRPSGQQGDDALCTSAPLKEQSLRDALKEAFAHRSYQLLVAGFFVCGFHLAFVTIHLPKYMTEKGLSLEVGGRVMALIGLFNIAGSLMAGAASRHLPRSYLLSFIYGARAIAIALFVWLPISPLSAYLFAAALGLLWLSTVPPTSSLCASMFGTKWLTMLFGFAFFSHQLGAFTALLIAGWTREAYGSYDVIWGFSVCLGIAAAFINLPIKGDAVTRSA